MPLNSLYTQLKTVRQADRFRLKKRIDGLARLPVEKRSVKAVENVALAMAASVANREQRLAAVPVLEWPDLPVVASRPEELTDLKDSPIPNIYVDPCNQQELMDGLLQALRQGPGPVPEELSRYGFEQFCKRLHAIVDQLLNSSSAAKAA